jgi:cyanophycinase
MTIKKIPKGKLLIIGGAENKGDSETDAEIKNKNFEQFEILNELLPEKNRNQAIEIVTTASTVPGEIEEMYKEAFEKIGLKKIGFLKMSNNYDAANPEYIKRINKAHAVFFSGGNQFRLSTILGNTDVLKAIQERYQNDSDFIVAGTSAGAMAMGMLMMAEGENNEALLKGTVKTTSGLGFIDGCLIDTHFAKRGRLGRLSQAIVINPTCIGIGLGEDTALIIRKGREAECKGSGMVVILDSKEIGHTNIAYVEEDCPVCIENLKLHILCKGNKYMFDKRKFLASPKDLKIENEARMTV